MHPIKKSFPFLVLLILYSTFSSYGQTGKIKGFVKDGETGEGLPSVSIIIRGLNIGAAADLDGNYLILNVPPGKYEIKASAIGYQNYIYQQVNVSSDLTTSLNFVLVPKSIELSKEIIVVAKRNIVTKDLTSSTAIINSSDMAALPVTEFKDILQLQAGIVGESVRGGRKGEVLYTVDGVSLTDLYDNSLGVDVNTNAIQELQFISGAFNAEYGKALSGVVNLATKEGNNKFTGTVTTYIGNHLSNHTNVFRHIDKINPFSIRNYEGSLSGPVINDNLYFFTTARYIYDDGYYYGKRVYNPWDITKMTNPEGVGTERYSIQQTGDGQYVPMNSSDRISLHGRLSLITIPNIKISLTSMFNKEKFKEYNHAYAYNPDGDLNRFQWATTNIFSLTHTLGANTFYRINLSYYHKNYEHYVYKDINDPRWTNDLLLQQAPSESPSFLTGGTRDDRIDRETSSLAVKYDLTSQIHKNHLLKVGFELDKNMLHNREMRLLKWKDRNGNGLYDAGEDGMENPDITLDPFVRMRIPDANDPNENLSINQITANPLEFSAYVQDKIEFDDLIINVGVRLDYFSPDGKILTDPNDPDIYRPRKPENILKSLDERRTYWYKKATDKIAISPRIGFAFPITATGVVHFSYGHFFQIPKYSLLYANPEYKFGTGAGNLGIAGNPDLKPEQTISGEIGLQQALAEDVVIDVTAYFRDIRNLTGTRADEIYFYGKSSTYSQYVNSDFGFVKGLIVSVNKSFGSSWSARLDYTLQSAKGNASDPNRVRNLIASNTQPEVQLIPLDWDQTHTLNLSMNYTNPSNWGGSILFQYGSGFPYTPDQSMQLSKLLSNSEIKPYTLSVDLKVYYDLMLLNSLRLSFFARVYNLFDTENQLNVYSDSGTADFTIEEYIRHRNNSPEIINSINEYYRNPAYYSEPRRVELGLSFFF
ncbi:MAG: TonB-dependent receptor [Ignavibacteriaceae bacterium]